MSIINLIKTSIYSLKAHKLRVFLTMIGIIIGISSVVTILSIGNGLKANVTKSLTNTNTDANVTKINISFKPDNPDVNLKLIEPFNQNDFFYIKKIDGVKKVEAIRKNTSLSSDNSKDVSISYFNKTTSTTELNTYNGKSLNIKYGNTFSKNYNINKTIILDFKTAKELFDSPKNSIGQGILVNGTYYQLIGILTDSDTSNSSSYISKNSEKNIKSQMLISKLRISITRKKDKNIIFNNIKKELLKKHTNLKGKYELNDSQKLAKTFEKIIGGLTAFIALVSSISLFVAGIGVMNIMYVSISERKREIGIRRAIGAKPRSILLQFLFEAILVTSIAGLLGMLWGVLLGKIVGVFIPFSPVFTIGSFLGSTITSISVGIIFGIVPAINASKIEPIKAIYM